MSTQAQELLNLCEQLPEPQRIELTEFAKYLLAHSGNGAAAVDRWLATPAGGVKHGVTTDAVMRFTRGDA